MLNAPSFSEDMLPRHFPRTKGQLEQNMAAAPMPTLSGLSLLLDDANKVFKSEPIRKVERVEPKKSFEQWKQQHQSILIENATTQQRKLVKKQVRFETGNSNEQQIPLPVSPHLELSYCEGSFGENQLRRDCHQQTSNRTGHCDAYERTVLHTRCDHKPISPSFSGDRAYNAADQTTVELPHFTHRTVRSESTKENYLSAANLPVHNERRQCNRNCCQTNHNNWEVMNYQPCNHGIQPNGCVNQLQVHQSHEVRPKTIISPFGAHVERNLKEQLTDDTLLSIMEEQQQHILLQQSQIMMQQKQNMMQQNQIYQLQHQVQQLLLRNGNNPNGSPKKLCPTSICDKKLTPPTIPNALRSINAIKTRNGTIDSMGKNGATTARSSIGVMTSFLGNVNDGMPNGMQQFNERFTTKLANEKFMENMGGEFSYKDSMLDKINDAIKNSSAMIDYRNNSGTDDDGCVSPNRQSDINIAAQALFYEASSTNNGCPNEPKTTDRSFALYMLGMKYDCAQEDASKNFDKREWQSRQTNGSKSDQVSVNLSPEVYDYLKRHGLLKQE